MMIPMGRSGFSRDNHRIAAEAFQQAPLRSAITLA